MTAEGFEAGQLAQATNAAAAIARMAARFGAGDDALGRIVRARPDAVEKWRRVDKALITALSQMPEKRDLHKATPLYQKPSKNRRGCQRSATHGI